MSTKVSGKKIYNNYLMFELELSDTIISFRELLGYIGVKDIYSGKEVIPFREKHIDFQKIMLSEFIN
ncbi:MAG: hypothetical protein KGD74_07335 [Candidatus Lokiarchaeota archaeon]|nr:hypothetical protein [Candidatus Lokiarchaeota archaeon]